MSLYIYCDAIGMIVEVIDYGSFAGHVFAIRIMRTFVGKFATIYSRY